MALPASPDTPRAPDALVHRALANRARRHLLDLLEGAAALDVRELAEQVALHVNTVRGHLKLLEEAGLVTAAPEQRDRPGRPRMLYRSTGTRPAAGDEPGYRFLAEVLASQLAAVADDPAAAAEAAGRAWGQYLVETPSPSAPVDPQAAVARVVDLLEDVGFAPERHDESGATPRVLLRHCPFLEVARQHQDIVCSIHLGIMRGALEELAAAVEVTDLVPFVEADLCVTHLRVPA